MNEGDVGVRTCQSPCGRTDANLRGVTTTGSLAPCTSGRTDQCVQLPHGGVDCKHGAKAFLDGSFWRRRRSLLTATHPKTTVGVQVVFARLRFAQSSFTESVVCSTSAVTVSVNSCGVGRLSAKTWHVIG